MQQCEEGDLVDSWLWQDIPSFIIIFSPAEKFANWGLYFLGEGTNNVLSIYTIKAFINGLWKTLFRRIFNVK